MNDDRMVRDLLERHAQTYAEEAGITLRDKPAALYQLLVLAMLASARISADIAKDAAKELFAAGWRTPRRMRESTWQQRVDALGRGRYRRYDESTATKLGENAKYLIERYHADLRRLRPGDTDQVRDLEQALTQFPRIGSTGAGVFCREVQVVWPQVSPYFDSRALRRARELGLPREPGQLAQLAPNGQVARVAAALARDS